MHITLEADYAIRIVSCLAKEHKRLDAKTISDGASVSLRFSLKILGKLVSSGVVKSFKGTSGGYELVKSAEEITFKDVIEAIEGKYFFSRCLSEEYGCNRGMSGQCKVQKVFNEISTDVEKKLEQYNFSMFIE